MARNVENRAALLTETALMSNDEICGVVREIESQGFRVVFQEYCEDPETPGFLGLYAGATIWDKKKVKIKTHDRTEDEIVATLRHELHHVMDPTWDCGNRGVW